MFFKDSRYYKLVNHVNVDARGRYFESKQLRLLPEVSGQYQHIVEDTDRLDNLAYKYYKKPRHWWRVCDANSDIACPRELLGKAPSRVARFGLRWEGLEAPWHDIRTELGVLPGVQKILLGDAAQPYPEEQTFDRGLLFSLNISLQAEITASILQQQLSPALDAAFQAEGHVLGAELHFIQIGPAHWQLRDLNSKALYTLRLQAGVIDVFESAIAFDWQLSVHYNSINISADQLMQKVEAIHSPGFVVSSPGHIGRIGKAIVIPPLPAGAAS